MLIAERYESSISSGNLVVNERSTFAATDVLASAAFATKDKPLAAALLRWFAGDKRALPELSSLSCKMLIGKAWHSTKTVLRQPQAERITANVLIWYYVGVCKECSGRGYALIPGAPILSDIVCRGCEGKGKVTFPFPSQNHQTLALWLAAEFEREHSFAISRMAAGLATARI